jgi:hypothetical protein
MTGAMSAHSSSVRSLGADTLGATERPHHSHVPRSDRTYLSCFSTQFKTQSFTYDLGELGATTVAVSVLNRIIRVAKSTFMRRA